MNPRHRSGISFLEILLFLAFIGLTVAALFPFGKNLREQWLSQTPATVEEAPAETPAP